MDDGVILLAVVFYFIYKCILSLLEHQLLRRRDEIYRLEHDLATKVYKI